MSQQFQEHHLQYLLKQLSSVRFHNKDWKLKERLQHALDQNDVKAYFQAFHTASETYFISCSLCAAPTSNDASRICVYCEESSDILKRLLSSYSKVWAITIEGGKLLDSLSNLASHHDRRNIYCPDCRGLVWSPVPHTVHHFPDCPAHHESRKT
jgi:hypothetical protein